MKRALAPFGIGVALLLAAASVLLAAPPPSFSDFLAADPGSSAAPAQALGQPAVATSTPATPADVTCGLRKYSCQACPSTVLPVKLCYEQICGSFVIVHCDPCDTRCILPPDGV